MQSCQKGSEDGEGEVRKVLMGMAPGHVWCHHRNPANLIYTIATLRVSPKRQAGAWIEMKESALSDETRSYVSTNPQFALSLRRLAPRSKQAFVIIPGPNGRVCQYR